MLLRRHRETPEVDPAFALRPRDTLDERFTPAGGAVRGILGTVDSAVTNDSRLSAEDTAKALKGADLKAALEAANLPTNGTAEEKRERYAEHLAAQEAINPGEADVKRDPAKPETDDLQTSTDDSGASQGGAENPTEVAGEDLL